MKTAIGSVVFASLLTLQVSDFDLDDKNGPSEAAAAADEKPRLQDSDHRRDERPSSNQPQLDKPELRSDAPQLVDRKASREPRRTMMIRLDNLPAVDVAETLRAWLNSEREAIRFAPVTVVPSMQANQLIVTGAAAQIEAVRNIIAELDQPQPQVRIRTVLLDVERKDPTDAKAIVPGSQIAAGALPDVLAGLAARGDVDVISKPELLIANNQPAFVQFATRTPRIVSSAITSRGRSNAVEYDEIGTTLGVTARVKGKKSVVMELDLDGSFLGNEREGVVVSTSPDGESIRSSEVRTIKLQSTITVKSGDCVLIGAMSFGKAQGRRELLLLVQPVIVK